MPRYQIVILHHQDFTRSPICKRTHIHLRISPQQQNRIDINNIHTPTNTSYLSLLRRLRHFWFCSRRDRDSLVTIRSSNVSVPCKPLCGKNHAPGTMVIQCIPGLCTAPGHQMDQHDVPRHDIKQHISQCWSPQQTIGKQALLCSPLNGPSFPNHLNTFHLQH